MLRSSFLIDEHDFTGLKCPLPVLKAKRVLKNLDKGKGRRIYFR